MMANDSFRAKWSDKRMEREDEGLRTIECLRGRLLAERAASKAANDESEQITKKVIELEKQLKMEIKSRNKAEKRLKYLIKKLDSLNILYVSADESSSLSEKSVISSVSSSSKSQHQMELQKTQVSKCVTDTDTSGERHNCPSHDDNLGSLNEAICDNSNENVIQSSKKHGDEDDLEGEDNNGSKSPVTKKDSDNEEDGRDTHGNVDNSMALVTVEEQVNATPKNIDIEDLDDTFDKSMTLVVVDYMVPKQEKQDLPISNGNVKDVLDALRYARESLQTSMEMRRHVKSNAVDEARLDRIAC